MQFNNRSAAAKTGFSMSKLRVKLLSISLALMQLGMSGASFAQTGPAAAVAIDSTDTQAAGEMPKNIFAKNLKPKVRHSAMLQKRPYNPIKKQDDQAQIPEIEMFVGESRVFPTPGVARIAVGNGTIMSAAALDNKEVLIFANAVGTSSLFVWNADGRYQRVKINIVPGDTSRYAREIAAFLTTIPNAKASVIGDKVIVEGDNLSDRDLEKIEELAKRYPQIVNFTNRMGWEKMIVMDVKVVEFPTTALREIGLKWGATGGVAVGGVWSPIRRGNGGPYQINLATGTNNPAPITGVGGGAYPLTSSLNILSVLNMGLNAQLNLMEQKGTAVILAQPTLSTRSGSKASFLAGGEFPYSVSNINGTTITFKKYGITLDIEPRVDHNGTIRAKIMSEVSDIDTSINTIAGPALRTRRTETEFNVQAGGTIVLSGLLRRDAGTTIDKIPLLGNIPVLGALFRSKRFQDNETELVVFVTPSVVDSNTPAMVDRVERTKERLQQRLGEQPYLSNPLQPGHDQANVNQVLARPQPAKVQKFGDDESDAPAKTSRRQVGSAPAEPVTQPALIQPADNVPLTPASQNPLQTSAQATNSGGALQVKLDGLLLRAEPTLKGRVLLQLGYGAIVQAGTQEAQPPGQAYWRNVRVGEINGWVASRWVKPVGTEPDRARSGSAIAQPDQQGQMIGLGARNSPDASGKSPVVESITATSPDHDAGGKRYRVNLNRLALRVTPDINAAVIQKLASGTVVEALPRAPRGHWIAVQVDGKRGWVAAQWLVPEQ
jgi:pilus assembly protein CpaC